MNQLIAVCLSDKCSSQATTSSKRGVVKNVPRSKIECPDCRHVLQWTRGARTSGMRHYASKCRKRIDEASV